MEIGRDVFHQVEPEFKDRWFVKEAFDPNSVKGLNHIEENRALQPLFAKFFVSLSTRSATCTEVLSLGLTPNCSSRRSPRPLTSLRLQQIWSFQITCQFYRTDLRDHSMMALI